MERTYCYACVTREEALEYQKVGGGSGLCREHLLQGLERLGKEEALKRLDKIRLEHPGWQPVAPQRTERSNLL